MQTEEESTMFAVDNRVRRPPKTNILSQGAWYYGAFGAVDFGANAAQVPRSSRPKRSGLKLASTIESGRQALQKSDDDNTRY